MPLTTKHLKVDFSLATGNFQGGGNSHTAQGLRITAEIVKAGGISAGSANVSIYGLPLSVMNQLSTYGQVLTVTGKNTVTISAWEDGQQPTVVFMGTIQSASMDGQAQPNVPFHVEAFVGGYENAKPVPPTSQPGSQDVAGLMGKIAQAAGFKFENNGVDVKVQNPYLPGTAIQQMHHLAEMARIERVVDNGTLAIWPAGKSRTAAGKTVISPQTGLVSYPLFNSQGVIVRTLWQPTLAYGQTVTVQSSITPACGDWVVYKLEYALACMEPNGPWFCDVWAARPGQQPVA